MATGLENAITDAFLQAFGAGSTGRYIFGAFGLAVTTMFYAVLRPPTGVFLSSVGLTMMLIFGNVLFGESPASTPVGQVHSGVVLFVILAFAFFVFGAFKKVHKEY